MMLFLFSFLCQAHASTPFARVEQTFGDVVATAPGQKVERSLKKGEALLEGTQLKTGERSFVKLLLSDNSRLTISSSTAMELKVSETKVTTLNLLGGSIRAIVTKSMAPSKEKMIVRTKSAAMGIRGTDFFVSFDAQKETTSLLTVQGKVAFVKLEPGMQPELALQANVRVVSAGTFSGIGPQQTMPSEPRAIPRPALEQFQNNQRAFPALKEGTMDPSAPPVKLPEPSNPPPLGGAPGMPKALPSLEQKNKTANGPDGAPLRASKGPHSAPPPPPGAAGSNPATQPPPTLAPAPLPSGSSSGGSLPPPPALPGGSLLPPPPPPPTTAPLPPPPINPLPPPPTAPLLPPPPPPPAP